MSTDEKVLKILEDLEKGQKALEAGQKALQDDMTAVKAETGKIPAIEQRLEHHNKLQPC
jgi:exonuclease VII small subunit